MVIVNVEPVFGRAGAPPGAGPPAVMLATGRQRAAARLIDAVAMGLAAAVPQTVLMGVVLSVDVSFEVMAAAALASMVAVLLLWVVLRVVRVVLWGCTVGQRIAGVRVIALDDLRSPGWAAAFRRFAPTWGSHVSPGVGPWSDVLAHRRDERTRQCLHDRAAGTVVVQAEEGEPVRRAVLAATLPVAAAATVAGFLLIT